MYLLMALVTGATIALQATMNARLGVLLKSSMVGTSIAFFVSFIVSIVIMLTQLRHFPKLNDIQSVPFYLWFSGGVLSAIGVSLLYYLIPKLGVGTMLSYTLSGQLIMALVASHLGWFNFPVQPVTGVKLLGTVALLAGVLLLNWEPNRGNDY